MTPFRFLHSADLHLGRRFGTIPEAARGRLVEARHQILPRLAAAARDNGLTHVLIAGDVFDTETPGADVRAQALAAIGADPGLTWWVIPGNHDSLAAEPLWDAVRRAAPPNLRLLDEAAPQEIAPGVTLLPCPLPRRRPGRDLTAWMPGCATPPGTIRLGLAHGPVQDFREDGAAGGAEIIPPDRAETAGLAYLALGDWHGALRIGARTWYAGTPECDGFRRAPRGEALAITLAGPEAPPEVQRISTGAFTWIEADLPLIPGQPAAEALAAILPPDRAARRDHLLRLRATGRTTLAERAALVVAADAAAAEFCVLDCDVAALATEYEAADLDAIDRAGALRQAADALHAAATDPARDEAARAVNAAALNRLYGYLAGGSA